MRTLIAVVVLLLLAGSFVGAQGAVASPSLMKATFGKLPLYFVENRGVYPDEVAYYVQGADKTLFFSKHGITFRLKGQDRSWVVKLEFVGANPKVQPDGQDKQQAVFSYFKGPKENWKTGLRTFSKVVYRNLWPGIDLVYRAGVGALKYEFQVAPGADPGRIRLRYRGAASVALADSGALKVETPAGAIEDAPPEAWQDIDGKRVPVAMGYRLGSGAAREGTALGFDVGSYDRTHPLVLDPAVLVYCGYIGGQGHDLGEAVAVDGQGNAYVTGYTTSTEATFPVRVGPDLTFNDTPSTSLGDAFVAKINAQGSALVYCGYIGGIGLDLGNGIAVDSLGNAYVTGYTYSNETTFPVRVGPDLTMNGLTDAFVAKVNAGGTGLIYCGYIGGAQDDNGEDIAVDASGNAYVVGTTSSNETTFPVRLGPDVTHNGGIQDAFVAKVNASGTQLAYCGYIGGSQYDGGAVMGYGVTGIAVDEQGNAYVAGSTASDETSFPVTTGPDLTYNGNFDAFVAKVVPSGTSLAYCGYVGGALGDAGFDVGIDSQGNAYVTGITSSDETTFPVRRGPDTTYNSGGDCFVAKINAAGTGLDYCGYIGGAGDDTALGIAVDRFGLAYVAGGTFSNEQTFPVLDGPDLTHNGAGSPDAFVAAVNAGGTGLFYCGYVGGSLGDTALAVAVDPAGNAFLTGSTASSQNTFPLLVGPSLTARFLPEAFVCKISLTRLVIASGVPRPGNAIALSLIATNDPGLPYQVGSSFGLGPIPLPGARRIPLSVDGLLGLSVGGVLPQVFVGYRGSLDSQGRATASLQLPPWPVLVGLRIHTAFVTFSPTAPLGISSISNAVSFSIVK